MSEQMLINHDMFRCSTMESSKEDNSAEPHDELKYDKEQLAALRAAMMVSHIQSFSYEHYALLL